VQWQTKAATATSDRACKNHSICKRKEWEIRYEGRHHDRKCEMRQVCHHTVCSLHLGKIRVQHHKKDHMFGFSHHHCKFDRVQMKCVCMCHNAKLDRDFAYRPQERYFWKKTVELRNVRAAMGSGSCPGVVYSPQGAEVPSTPELCRADSIGRQIVVSDGLPFEAVPTTGFGQASSILIFNNDRISFMGSAQDCPGFAARTETREVEVMTCVKQLCPHPKCCDCGNSVCSAGHGAGACARFTHKRAMPTQHFGAP
jgi:hypothetical protein